MGDQDLAGRIEELEARVGHAEELAQKADYLSEALRTIQWLVSDLYGESEIPTDVADALDRLDELAALAS